MRRDLELALIDRCVESVRDGSRQGTETDTVVSVEPYRQSEVFARERELIFAPSFQVVGHASQVAQPGGFFTTEVAGLPIIVIRDDDTVRALINVCRHRGATVELQPSGTCKKLVCPYHAWTYNRDGTLAALRQRDGFPTLDSEAHGLVELPCRVSGGLVWVRPQSGELDLDDSTRAMTTELAGLCGDSGVVFKTTSREWRANWKLIVDGGLESYHFRIAHRETVGPLFADAATIWDFVGDHVRTILPRADIRELTSAPRDEWSIRKCAHVLYALAPNATVLVQERHYELLIATPLAVDRTRIDISTIAPDPGRGGLSDRATQYLEANHAFTLRTLNEDFVLAEQIQRGIESGANAEFRFATFEGALAEWHARYDARMAAK